MMKRNACYSILIALLSTLTLTACIESSGLEQPTDPEAKDSYGKHSYSGCGDNDKKYEPRCEKPINFDKFAMASRIDSITFPMNVTENPIYKVIAEIDTAAGLVDPAMTVAKKIEEQIGDGRFNLIVEFLGWEKDSERPKDHLPIMLWPGEKPEDGKTEIKTKENGLPSASNDSAFSKSTFINAKYTKEEGDEYKVAATSVVPIQFPVLLFRVKTLVEVQKAQLTATIKKTEDGIEIVKGKISGEVRKDSILNAVYKLQQDCHNNYGLDNCIELDPRRHCSVGHTDGCKKDGQVDKVCKMAAAICTQEETLLRDSFKNRTTLEAVIDITGKPIQIEGWK